MEPLSIQAAGTAPPRPALAPGGDLSALLREGRLVAGQVLGRLDGRTLLVALGRHRVPAEAHVELAAGERFLARVEAGERGPVLRILGAGAGHEPALLAALRAAVGSQRPIGELLGELAARLRATLGAGGPGAGAARRLARDLEGHLPRPGAGGAELGALVARAGQGCAGLLLAGLRGRDPRAARELAEELAERVVAELLARGEGQAPAAPRLAQLARALREPLGRALEGALAAFPPGQPPHRAPSPGAHPARADAARRAPADGPHPALADTQSSAPAEGEQEHSALADEEHSALADGMHRALLDTLRRARAALPEPLRAAAGQDPDGLVRAVLAGPAGESLARRLAALAAADPAGPRPEPAGDLGATLLRALEELAEGPARAAVRRALAHLESEQLLNLARRELDEGRHVALPFPDGGRWSTLHLFEHPRRPAGGPAAGEPFFRLSLAVELTALGPLRAELGWRPGELRVRVTASGDGAAARLRAGLEPLRERLAAAGDAVEIAVAVAPREELEIDGRALDVRYLRGRHLISLSG